jgi:Zn-finger protein
MTPQEQMIEGIKENGKQKKGMAHLINYLEGQDLTQRQAIHAYCYHCSGYGEEEDCEQVTCPLYPFAPYSSNRRIARKKKDVVNAPTTRHSILKRVSEVK